MPGKKAKCRRDQLGVGRAAFMNYSNDRSCNDTDDRPLVPVPMTGFKMPTLATLLPAMRNPVVTAPLAYPIPRHPYVAAAIPAPVSRRPDVACARRRHD